MKSKIIVGAIIVLLVIAIVNAFLIFSSSSNLNKRVAELKELNRPAQIQVVKIDGDCADCFKVDTILQKIRENFNVTQEASLSLSSEESKALVEKYNIQKLPAVIITGETNKAQIQDFELKDGALFFTGTQAPYTDARSGISYGFVTVTNLVDSSCLECTSLTGFTEGLKKAGVFIKSENIANYNTPEGKDLIKKFDVKHVPALIISQDINYYPEVQQQLVAVQAKEKDGFYALHATLPPYRNLTSDKIVGLIEAIMIKDNSCQECYDVKVNKQILQRFGMYIKTEKTYDVSSKEGKDFIAKYNITKVPMILVSPEGSIYSTFVKAWEQVGTVEKDGWYVMNAPEVVGTVKDLATGQLIQTQEN